MKIWSVGLFGLALAVCMSSALVAQEDGRGRGGRGGPGEGRGEGRGFGGGMGMGMSGGALELIGLLRMEEVRKEVGMTPETFQSVQSAMPDMRSLFQASEGDRASKLKEANAKAQEVIDEALSPAQQKRLLGLLVQQQGARAVTNELVAKEIGLDAAKVQELQEVMMKSGEGMREKMREAFTGGGDREKIREAMEEMRKEVDKSIEDKLSDKQKEDLEKLKGDAFTFPERPSFGRGGPGAGGPGAGRDGAGRDGAGRDGAGRDGAGRDGGREPGNRRGRGGAQDN